MDGEEEAENDAPLSGDDSAARQSTDGEKGQGGKRTRAEGVTHALRCDNLRKGSPNASIEELLIYRQTVLQG